MTPPEITFTQKDPDQANRTWLCRIRAEGISGKGVGYTPLDALLEAVLMARRAERTQQKQARKKSVDSQQKVE